MKKAIVFVSALWLATSVFAQNWTLDKAHAKLGFTVTHMMMSEVEGTFKKFDVTLTSAQPDFSDASISMTADVYSINTDVEQRDQHLRNEDFFDVSKYSTITFKGTSFKKVEGKNYKLTGDLTMRGVTKPVELKVIFNGTMVHPYTKKTVAGFKITGTVKRTDFGIGPKFAEAMLSDEVQIIANAEFIKD